MKRMLALATLAVAAHVLAACTPRQEPPPAPPPTSPSPQATPVAPPPPCPDAAGAAAGDRAVTVDVRDKPGVAGRCVFENAVPLTVCGYSGKAVTFTFVSQCSKPTKVKKVKDKAGSILLCGSNAVDVPAGQRATLPCTVAPDAPRGAYKYDVEHEDDTYDPYIEIRR